MRVNSCATIIKRVTRFLNQLVVSTREVALVTGVESIIGKRRNQRCIISKLLKFVE